MNNRNLQYVLIALKTVVFILIGIIHVSAQEIQYARAILDTLTSPAMHGRGYVNNGDKIAAEYIQSEFKRAGLKCFGESFYQPFGIQINTFPDTIEVLVDDQRLIPGKDFVYFSSSPAISGTFDLAWSLADTSGNFADDFSEFAGKVVVTDRNQKDYEKENSFGSAGIIYLMKEKVWWHVSNGRSVRDYFQLQILKEKLPSNARKITIRANNQFFENYLTQNIVAYIPGKTEPDSFFVFTAHYDHLGRMGSATYFPGANDNASGVAMLLDLAKYFSLPQNQPDHSIAFIAFSAEEVGLCGSEFYTEHPLFPLAGIKFLVNLDMVGSGSMGIKVVNGSIFKDEFQKLEKINSRNEYILTVSERGEAPNSDHYPFYKNGVPCFFIYTLGEECREYHNIFDVPANVPLTEYEDVFRLMVDFQAQIRKEIQ